MDPDKDHFDRASRRIERWIALLGAAAAVTGLVAYGWHWAGGFVLGAVASWLNFRWLKQLVEALGESGASARPRKRLVAVLIIRYLLLGAIGYAILLSSPVTSKAALVGFFVPVAAVILEILFELLYAGT